MSDIIDLLKAKEKEIEANIAQARVKAEEITNNTSIEISKIKIEAAEEAEKARVEINSAHQKELTIKIEKIERLGRKAAEAIDTNSRKHYEDALKMVLETITNNT